MRIPEWMCKRLIRLAKKLYKPIYGNYFWLSVLFHTYLNPYSFTESEEGKYTIKTDKGKITQKQIQQSKWAVIKNCSIEKYIKNELKKRNNRKG